MLVRCRSVFGNASLNSSAKHAEDRGSDEEETQIAQRSGEGIKTDGNLKEGNEIGSHKGGRRKARRRRPATSGDRKEGQHDPATVVWEFELSATLDGAAGWHAIAGSFLLSTLFGAAGWWSCSSGKWCSAWDC